MREDEGLYEDFEPGAGPSAWEGTGSGLNPYDAERLALEAMEAEENDGDYYDPDAKRKAVEKKCRDHASARLGEHGLTRQVEARTAVFVPVHIKTVWEGSNPKALTASEPVGVSELYRLNDEGAADLLHRVSSALEDVPADRQEEVYHNLRDKAAKALQGVKGSRRAAESFVDRHLAQPLGERSPYTKDGLRDVDVVDLELPSMLVAGMIPCGEVGIITGDSGTGKSWLTAELGTAVAFGGSWLGQPVETTGHVRYFLPEGRVSFPRRLAGVLVRRGVLDHGSSRSDLSAALAGRVSITDGHTVLNDPRLEEHLRADVEAKGTRLVVFDTLNRSLGAGQDENDANDAKAVVNMLHRLAADTGCTFLLIHHPPHGEKRERGSRVWRDAPDFRFLIYGTDRDVRQSKPVTLWNVKQRNIPPADDVGYRLSERSVQYDGEEITTCTVERAAVVTDVPIGDRIRWFVESNPGLPKSRVMSGVRGDDKEVSREIDQLLTAGKLRNANEGSKGAWALHVAGEWEPSEDVFDADTDLSLSDVTGEDGGSDG